jgi:hypothetical protein
MSCAVVAGLIAVVAVFITWVLTGFDSEAIASVLRGSGGRFFYIGLTVAILAIGKWVLSMDWNGPKQMKANRIAARTEPRAYWASHYDDMGGLFDHKVLRLHGRMRSEGTDDAQLKDSAQRVWRAVASEVGAEITEAVFLHANMFGGRCCIVSSDGKVEFRE